MNLECRVLTWILVEFTEFFEELMFESDLKMSDMFWILGGLVVYETDLVLQISSLGSVC